jgi:glycosyltransferase involved in cell wall biosynthesis
LFNDSAIVGPPMAKLGGAKVVVSRRDMGYWYTEGLLGALRVSNRFVDVLVANSEAVRENVVAHEHMPRARTRVVYNGYEIEPVETLPSIDAALPVVGIVARLREVKRHVDLIAAFKQVVGHYPCARLHIVGDGELRADLGRLVVEHGLVDAVSFLGESHAVHEQIRRFTVGVLCSESEGFSNALVEYLACGVPAVCTSVGGNPEIVRDGYNGFLVPVGAPDRLAAAIVRAIEVRSASDEMARNALQSAERYTLTHMIDQYAQLYLELAA